MKQIVDVWISLKIHGTKQDNSANLLITDTGSLVYETETDDICEDFYKNKNLLDFSDYLEDSKYFDPVNKNEIGKMNDKVKGKIISELVRLK